MTSQVTIVGQKWRYSPHMIRNDESGGKSRLICSGLSRLIARDPGASPQMTHNVTRQQRRPAVRRFR